jgi:hypothetical protein
MCDEVADKVSYENLLKYKFSCMKDIGVGGLDNILVKIFEIVIFPRVIGIDKLKMLDF